MKLFEVIFWGSHGRRNSEDTIYLVRAPDFHAAVENVVINASRSDHNGEGYPLAHVVYEIGTDLSPYADANPGIIRGPYFAFACNRGWRAWHRKIEGSDYTKGWIEEIYGAEPTAAPNGGPAASADSSTAPGRPPSVR